MQREFILKNVLLRKDHPTAEKIYEDVREAIPNISLGTVYRNLNLLTEEGLDFSVSLSDKTVTINGCEHCVKTALNALDDLGFEGIVE